eukprot:3802342-Amphidinium_carterae.1
MDQRNSTGPDSKPAEETPKPLSPARQGGSTMEDTTEEEYFPQRQICADVPTDTATQAKRAGGPAASPHAVKHWRLTLGS